VSAATPPPVPAPAPATVAPQPRRNTWLILALVVLVVVILVRACATHENKYEKIVTDFNQAVQRDDIAAVQRLENVGTAADTSAQRVGHAADELAPLGAVKRVKENTPAGDRDRTHEFDVTFAKGTVHETFEFDPQDKIFHFRYDPPQKST
jgi:hypothetical protein